MQITPAQYVEYLINVAGLIGSKGEYITALDAAIGDGDHWLNINIGFQKLVEKADDLKKEVSFKAFFNNLANIIMSAMGGTSGALYGGAYMAAAGLIGDVAVMDENMLADMLQCWQDSMMRMGNTQPGFKTMVDTLYPAVSRYKSALGSGLSSQEALEILKEAAWEGANSTKDMIAVRGRASNQPGKGVGHLDPGAVTMAMQLECLSDYLIEN